MKRGRVNTNSKAQTTIFIIIAVIVVILIITFVYFNNSISFTKLDAEYFESSELKPQLTNIESLIINCLDETSKQALETIAIQGGYYQQPKKALELDDVFVPYYYYEGQYQNPTKQQIQTELEKFVNNNLKNCLNNIQVTDFTISIKTPKTQALIKQKNVEFKFDSQIKIIKDKKHVLFEINQHPLTQPSALYDILEVADYITESHKEDSEMYCISCVDELAEEKDLYVDIIPITDITTLIIISDNRTSSEPYSFEFLNQYTGDETSPEFEVGGNVPEPPTGGVE